jgi:hypothetical protein
MKEMIMKERITKSCRPLRGLDGISYAMLPGLRRYRAPPQALLCRAAPQAKACCKKAAAARSLPDASSNTRINLMNKLAIITIAFTVLLSTLPAAVLFRAAAQTTGAAQEPIQAGHTHDIKNLILIAQVLNPPYSFVQRLSNIFLDVPGVLLEIPRDYKQIERDRWTKVETARVTYKGKPSKDYGVFRSPGGEMFIWVNDARYPWHYLVRPQESRVETAFQGLLVTISGKYIWQTKETEAFSRTDYRDRKREEHEPGVEERVIVTLNSVKFRSNDYREDRAMIEVRW